jgi:hypothetical protein
LGFSPKTISIEPEAPGGIQSPPTSLPRLFNGLQGIFVIYVYKICFYLNNMNGKEMKKYNMDLDQASFLVTRLMELDVPVDYLPSVLDAISGAYMFGHGDAKIGKERKDHEYSLQDILIKIEQAAKGGDS